MASERVNELQASIFPSLKRRGGCGINKKARSLRSAADGVVSSAKLFRPKDFAELFLRLRPIGLALRATPSARTKVASRHRSLPTKRVQCSSDFVLRSEYH